MFDIGNKITIIYLYKNIIISNYNISFAKLMVNINNIII